ncbi:integrase catalytic domain-containing protein [Trichonephila clavipes]|uniref:RNA-directed DNA polymerase n=1 Tax=Trichonephila clavipes TaxID=2585209 RepID=A0A8X6VMQ6_TRICX|nr:integrase catalytic domain-containing protein [Trichonephila clavipes]
MTLAHKSATILLMGRVCYVICPSAPPNHPGLTPLESKFAFHIVLKLELSNLSIQNIEGSLVVRASDSRPEGLGSMLDVTKYPPSAHGFTCRNCGGGDRGRVAIYRPFGEVSLSLNRTVTCMVLKANDRRTSCPCHDEFRGPRSDYVRQVALATTTTEYGGHLKFFKTYHRLSENFFWQNMYKDTKNFVRSCTVCLSRKNAFNIPPAPHQPVEQSQEPGETCHIDIFGPLKTTHEAFFDNYIVHRGCPHKLVVDNATYFKSSEFVEFCRVMGIHKRHISSYSAHVNGRVEKPNQSLANILASVSQNTNDWDEQLPHTMLALNSAIHEATYTSPFFLEHGRDIRLSYTYEKTSNTPQNKYAYVEKLLPSLEQIFNKVLNNLKDQEASHVDLSTRATKQHHYDYKIGSLCFIKTPNINFLDVKFHDG